MTDIRTQMRRDRIRALEAENARLRAEREWQPIETAPRDGTLLFLWNGKKMQRGFWDKVDCAWVLAFKTTTRRKPVHPAPTHWMPLPNPPTEKNSYD